MSDNLTTKEIETDADIDDATIEFTTREEYIQCAVAALGVVSEMNAMTAADTMRQKRIQRKCLRIIDDMVSEMYEELFSDDED